MDIDIDKREGLPAALRVLVEEWPRAQWEGHPNFRPLAEFWMDRHIAFRRLLAMLTDRTEARLDDRIDGPALAAQVSRLGGALVGGLEEHHNVEDHHYFPMMTRMEPRIARGFEMLDADHDALHGWLASLTAAANGAIGANDRDSAGTLHGELIRFAPLLDRHLTDEEDIVVPVILKTGLG